MFVNLLGDRMFGFDLKKLTGAILVTGVAFLVIGFIGDALVVPKTQKAATVAVATTAPTPPKKIEKVVSLAVRLANSNAKAGEKVSNKCKSCHDMTARKKVEIGPPLWDIVQASKAGNGRFKYSSPMGSMGGKWSYKDLDAFIASPRGFLKGTKMTFRGLKNEKQRANLIAYLRSLSSAPKPLP